MVLCARVCNGPPDEPLVNTINGEREHGSLCVVAAWSQAGGLYKIQSLRICILCIHTPLASSLCLSSLFLCPHFLTLLLNFLWYGLCAPYSFLSKLKSF